MEDLLPSHINTFSKGMTSDVNIIYQPDGTYRYMKNCQLISQDGNNFAIKDCLGNVLKFTINRRYATSSSTFDSYPMSIGFISFVDQLVVFSTNSESVDGNGDPVGGYGEIGLINYKPYREGISPVIVSGNYNNGYVPLYHHASLKFSKLKQIEGFAYEENSASRRVYWTDNFNEPRVFNISDPIFTTYIASGSLSLTAGTQYMILEGIVEYPVASGVFYGPASSTAAPFTTSGNILTTDGVHNTYTATTGTAPTPKVIAYYPYQLLSFTPNRALGNIEFDSYGSGNKYCGAKMYFYRLADPANGIFTSWSYGCVPINVETPNSVPSSPSTNPYFDLTGGGTTSALLNSGKSVKITISNIDTNYPRIEVACAEFDQSVNVPRIISVVYSAPITGSTMTIEDSGNSTLGQLSLSDITLFPASILRCKTMTTDKNYILIGNTKERQEFAFDTSGITIAEITHSFPVHEYDSTLCSNVLAYTDVSPTPGVNPTFIIQESQYIVTFGNLTTDTVVYNGVNYITGQVIIGVFGVQAIAYTGTASVRPCVSKNKYTTNTAAPRPDYIELKSPTSFWSYRDPAVAHHKKGYWANEKYRFGILFYDLKGNPMYVRYINDHTFTPLDGTNNPITFSDSNASYKYWFLRQRAVSFSNIVIPASIIDQISGFSIVRAERTESDKRIITEGFLMQTGADGGGTNFKPIAGPIASGANINTDWNGSVDHYYSLICPDRLVNYPLPSYGPNAYIEGAFWTQPTLYAGPLTYMKSVGQANQVESRWMYHLPNDGNTRSNRIVNLQDPSEYNQITNFGTANLIFSNVNTFQPGVVNCIDNSCVGGPGSVASLANTYSVGGKKTIIEIEGSLLDYGGGHTYGDLANAGVNKLAVDVVVPNSNQYGGTSAAAISNTLYISTGHFQPINVTVKAETLSGGNYVFNNVEVWGGDCYTCLVDYGHSLYNTDFAGFPYVSNSWGIKFPMQCNANYDLRRGSTVANSTMHVNAGPNYYGITYNTGGNVRLESFQYNYGYSSDGSPFSYPALPINYANVGQFKFRIRYAGVKFPNELVNIFRVFNVNDYKDVDGQGGEINNIRTKDGRVIVWQNAITSTVPILERQILTGLSGAATTLGTGGVVDRYDPISSYFGNQHQQGLVPTEYGFAWFDMRRKAFVVLDMNQGIIEISKIDGLKGFFDEAFLEVQTLYNSNTQIYLNSPTFADNSSRPLMGVGITGVYDPKFKMTYLTLKYNAIDKIIDGARDEHFSYINKDFTIGYYHPEKMFIGFYDWTPSIAWNHNQIVVSANNPKNKTKYFGVNMLSTDFVIGDIVPWLNAEYIVIAPITIAAYPPVGAQAPDAPGSIYFTKINDTSQIWIHNQETDTSSTVYQYNKFFGQVVDNVVDIVINPKTDNPFAVLNMQQKGNLVNVTDVYTNGDTQSAADNNIITGNRFYRPIFDYIASNLPLSATGRIVDRYLKVRLYKKNWTTNPTVLTGSTRILQWVKSFFEEKR